MPCCNYQVGSPVVRVAVDISRPLPLISDGNKYICATMDYFTRWPEAYAIPDQEATTIDKVFWQMSAVVLLYLMISVTTRREILSRESLLTLQFCKLFGIRRPKHCTAPTVR